MECMEARALKSSFIIPEISMKVSTNPTCDDFWCVTGVPGAADDFSVDHFFDLPNEEENTKEEGEEQEDKKYSNSSLSVDHSNSLDFSPELAIPVDDIKELELWSHLMDESIPECPNLTSVGLNKKTGFLPAVEPGRNPGCTRVLFIPSAVPHKPRSKRPRIAANRSKFLISPLKTEFLLSSSPSSPVSTLSFFPGPPHFLSVRKPALKKQKKKPAFEPAGPVVQRRCSHCQVTKTPQWRAGPTGPKSLCNACGVRFKSGRLFPEYRPACSPTFSSEVHSNSHRKVLEMRRKREPTLEPLTGSSPTSTISGS